MPATALPVRLAYLSEVQRALATERLDAYVHPSRQNHSPLDKLGCYTWNVALCESLYPMFHAGEVLLRNSIYRAIESAYHVRPRRGLLCWLDAGQLVLTQEHARRVAVAKTKLAQRLQVSGLPMTTGRLIAELTFGFWTYLFDTEYGYRGPNDQRLWPRLLGQVFPHLPAAVPRQRDMIQRKLTRIRELRNRAFHHEPIWKYPDLQQRYDEAVDLIRWMSPAVAKTVVAMNRFEQVYCNSAHRYLRRELHLLSGKP